MNNKQRAFLSSKASQMNPLFNIGKASLTPEIITAVDEALLKNCFDDPKEIANVIAERTHSEVVRVIGKKIVLYRAAKKPKLTLPQ